MPSSTPDSVTSTQVNVQVDRTSSSLAEDEESYEASYAIGKRTGHLIKRLADHASEAKRKAKVRNRRRQPSVWLDAHQELELVTERRGAKSWHARTVAFIQQPWLQTLFLWLLLLDVLVLFAELFLDAEFPVCSIIVRDAVSCCPTDANATDDAHHRLLLDHRLLASTDHGDDHGDGHHALCTAAGVAAYHAAEAACDAHKHPAVHTAHVALLAVSISILSLFAVELVALLVALGGAFCRNPLYVLDFIVVIASLTLEITLFATPAGDMWHMLVLARLWRFLRIAHGVGASTVESQHHKHEAVHHTVSELEGELARLLEYSEKLENLLKQQRESQRDSRWHAERVSSWEPGSNMAAIREDT